MFLKYSIKNSMRRETRKGHWRPKVAPRLRETLGRFRTKFCELTWPNHNFQNCRTSRLKSLLSARKAFWQFPQVLGNCPKSPRTAPARSRSLQIAPDHSGSLQIAPDGARPPQIAPERSRSSFSRFLQIAPDCPRSLQIAPDRSSSRSY